MTKEPRKSDIETKRRRRLDLDGFIPYRISVMQEEVSRAISRTYAEKHGLMRNDWRVMAVLGGEEPLSANQVCARTNMDKVQVSRAIARLKERGLVSQHQDNQDRRRSILRLTHEGKSMYRDIVPAALAKESDLLAALTDGELKQLDTLIDKIYARARKLNGG